MVENSVLLVHPYLEAVLAAEGLDDLGHVAAAVVTAALARHVRPHRAHSLSLDNMGNYSLVHKKC